MKKLKKKTRHSFSDRVILDKKGNACRCKFCVAIHYELLHDPRVKILPGLDVM